MTCNLLLYDLLTKLFKTLILHVTTLRFVCISGSYDTVVVKLRIWWRKLIGQYSYHHIYLGFPPPNKPDFHDITKIAGSDIKQQ
jgi:hypothetical protein